MTPIPESRLRLVVGWLLPAGVAAVSLAVTALVTRIEVERGHQEERA